TINVATGAAMVVGPTGFEDVSSLEFGPDGTLYGGLGGNNSEGGEVGSLITLDPLTGQGTLVGATGFWALSGLSFFPDLPGPTDPAALYHVALTAGQAASFAVSPLTTMPGSALTLEVLDAAGRVLARGAQDAANGAAYVADLNAPASGDHY